MLETADSQHALFVTYRLGISLVAFIFLGIMAFDQMKMGQEFYYVNCLVNDVCIGKEVVKFASLLS